MHDGVQFWVTGQKRLQNTVKVNRHHRWRHTVALVWKCAAWI